MALVSNPDARRWSCHQVRVSGPATRNAVRVIDGDRPVAPEVAIFLIYQPGDFLDSLFLTLDHLIEKGMR